METFVCKKCGKELPVSEFQIDYRYACGHSFYCDDCRRKRDNDYRKKYYALKKKKKSEQLSENIESTVSQEVGNTESNSPLSQVTPRDIIAELRRRGYTGNLSYTVNFVV